MNISNYILDELKQKGKVSLYGFGDFVLENTAAILDTESKNILPPGKQIIYVPNYNCNAEDFIVQLSSFSNITKEESLKKVVEQTGFWKNKINQNEAFTLEYLGSFKNIGGNLQFFGDRVSIDSPDFFGLETINLEDLKRKMPHVKEIGNAEVGRDYQFNKSILWLFLILAPIAAMVYFGITEKDRLFGKKSFDDLSVKNATHRIAKDSKKSDSTQIKAADSAKKDRIKAIIPVVSTKKWHSPKKWKSKKKSKNKWSKRKNR